MMKKHLFEKLWIQLASVYIVTVSTMLVSCGSKIRRGEVQAPNTYVVLGIDVSEHQGMIQWDSLAIAKEMVDSCISEEENVGLPEMLPVSFAIIRATKSSDYVDKQFQRNFKAARQLGISLGVYHFLTDTASGRQQAENYISMVKLEEDDLPPILDIEVFSPHVIDIAKEWLDVVEEHYGRQAIIYSNKSGFDDIIAMDSVLNSRDLWMAHLKTYPPGMTNCKLWQMSQKGKIAGISENIVDIDMFLGDNAEFKQYIKGTSK